MSMKDIYNRGCGGARFRQYKLREGEADRCRPKIPPMQNVKGERMKSKETTGGAGAPPFVAGDKVVTEFDREKAHVVRRIEMCVADSTFGSGWRASADEGGVCPHCKRPNARPVRNVDSVWFRKANKGQA